MKRRLKLDWVTVLLILGSLVMWGRFPFEMGHHPGYQYIPFIVAIVYLLMLISPLLDRKGGLTASLNAYTNIIRAVVIAILFQYYVGLAVHLGLLYENFARYLSFPHVPIGIALLLIGNHLPQIKPNSFVGVRTHWTLKDPDVWRKTNRLCGYFSMLTGIFLILSPLLLPVRMLFIGLVLILPIYGMLFILYSYWLYHRKSTKIS
ncbi:MAG: SdpI family protein [Anaerolineales bacterium]|nr:SdpI family protein [Anaerolineales bacterium]